MRRVLGRASATPRPAAIRDRAPGPGEIFVTPLEPTFNGIRFEVGRAVEHVLAGRRDPLVVDFARYISDRSCLAAEQAGVDLTPANVKYIQFEGILYWMHDNTHYVQDPTNVEFMETPGRMLRRKLTPQEFLDVIWDSIAQRMAAAHGGDYSRMSNPEGRAVGDCEEIVTLHLSLCMALDIYPVRFQFGGVGDTLHHVWGGADLGNDDWHEADATQKGFGVDEILPFDDNDFFVIPLPSEDRRTR